MAAIGKIREKSGLLIAIVGIALAGFVLNDLLGSIGKNSNQGDRFTTANIGDEEIRTDYFQNRLEEVYALMQDRDQEVNSDVRFDVMSEMWTTVEKETIIRQQCEEIGLAQNNGNDFLPSISMKEYIDMLKGENRHPAIVQSFPQPEQLDAYFRDIDAAKNSGEQEQVEQAIKQERQWKSFETSVKFEQLSNKYNTLIQKSFYVPTALLEAQHNLQNEPFDVKYFGIRYNSQNMNSTEEAIAPTQEEYEAYYEEHKNEFNRVEENRTIEYVVWNVSPSEKDMQEIETKVKELYLAFQTQPADEINWFVNRNRGMNSQPFDSLWKKASELSPQIDSLAYISEDNHVFPPIVENNAYKIVRVLEHDVHPDSLRASHILIAYSGSLPGNDSITRVKMEASAMADSLFAICNSTPMRFEELASTVSDDTESAKKQGDLDWFLDNSGMVPQFKTAVLENNIGDIVLVESQFGFHIIKVTNKTEPHQKVRVAEVSVDIKFSKETRDGVYMEANRFAAANKDSAKFFNAIEELAKSPMKFDANKMSKEVPGIKESRNIIKWAFGIDGAQQEEVEVYSVSDVFDYPSQIVVGIVTGINEEGIAPLEEVKEDITKLVQRDVEAKKIMAEVGENPDFNALAKEKSIAVDSLFGINFASNNLGGYGPEPYVLGNMTKAEAGKTYGPIKGNQGVFFYVVSNRQEVLESQDNFERVRTIAYSTFNNRVVQNYGGANSDVYKALKKEVEVEDFRYNFW